MSRDRPRLRSNRKRYNEKEVVYKLHEQYYYPEYKEWETRKLTPVKLKTPLKIWKKSKVSADFYNKLRGSVKKPQAQTSLNPDKSFWEQKLKQLWGDKAPRNF